jgi:hypothetical protein
MAVAMDDLVEETEAFKRVCRALSGRAPSSPERRSA